MKKRNRSSKETVQIVLALGVCRKGIRAEANLADVCNCHQTTQSQFYRWRDEAT